MPENASANLEPNLVAIMDTFSVTSVDTLEATGNVDQIAAETWQRVFHAFLSLRTLAVAGDGMLDAVWAGLLRATTAAVQRDRAVCCPLLFEIATDNDPSSHSSSSFQRPRRCSWRYARPWAQVSMLARPALKSSSCPLAIPEPNDGQTETLHHDRDHIVLEDVKMLVGELDYRELQAL